VIYLASGYSPEKAWTPREPDNMLDADTQVHTYHQCALRLVSRATHLTEATLAKGDDEMTTWILSFVHTDDFVLSVTKSINVFASNQKI